MLLWGSPPTHTYARTHTRTRARVHTRTHADMHARTHMHMCTRAHTHTRRYARAHTHICTRTHTHMRTRAHTHTHPKLALRPGTLCSKTRPPPRAFYPSPSRCTALHICQAVISYLILMNVRLSIIQSLSHFLIYTHILISNY